MKQENKLIDIKDNFYGYTATWIDRNGNAAMVHGTFALGVPMSWSKNTHVTETGFQCGEYVNICGHWQV